jgi:hypothetical protein
MVTILMDDNRVENVFCDELVRKVENVIATAVVIADSVMGFLSATWRSAKEPNVKVIGEAYTGRATVECQPA